MASQKKENKKTGMDETYGITEFDVESFRDAEIEKFNGKNPAIEIPDEVQDDIDNDYDIKEHDSDEDEND